MDWSEKSRSFLALTPAPGGQECGLFLSAGQRQHQLVMDWSETLLLSAGQRQHQHLAD